MSEVKMKQARRRGRSLFGPLFMIAIGVCFLLGNLGIVSDLNWVEVLQLWPLLLIFLGVNMIVQRVPSPYGTLLSGMVTLIALALFGYVLFFGEDNAIVQRFGVQTNREMIREEIVSAGNGSVEEMEVRVDLDAVDGEFYSLANGRNLLAGTISYSGALLFQTDLEGGNRAEIVLDDQNNSIFPFFWIGDGSFGSSDEDVWQIGLSPEVATDLRIDAGSGDLTLDLVGLHLTDLNVDIGSGSSQLFLPEGEMDVRFDAGSGSTEMTVAGDGRYNINHEGGSGELTVYVAAGTAVRVDFEAGSGRLHVDESFSQVRGEDNDGVWETAGVETADSVLDLKVDMGSGSVWIRPLGGR